MQGNSPGKRQKRLYSSVVLGIQLQGELFGTKIAKRVAVKFQHPKIWITQLNRLKDTVQMNDFLQTLRNSQAERQRTPMTRKSYDAAFYNPNSRYPYSTRSTPSFQHPNQIPPEEPAVSPLFEVIGMLSTHVQRLAENQKFLIDAQERSADMLERQVVAIEKILDHLKISS